MGPSGFFVKLQIIYDIAKQSVGYFLNCIVLKLVDSEKVNKYG